MLTPGERRGASLIVALLLIGAAHDLWHARRPRYETPAALPVPRAQRAEPPPLTRSADARTGIAPNGAVDLNTADARALDALPGIGPVLAGRIVEHRRTHGPFRSPEDLLAVRGIGPRLFERLRAHVVVHSTAPSEPPDRALRKGPAGAGVQNSLQPGDRRSR